MSTVPLDRVRATDVALAGGKGANLGELMAAGLPVPAGFVVTTDAYRRAARGEPTPEDLAAITAAYADLGEPLVAVRSSATIEDLAEGSFAGQFETVLGVRGPEAVARAVRRCWASLSGPTAAAYRAYHEIDAEAAMAVVVQVLVDAEAAGVMFTADPLTGRRDRTRISAALGLGDGVVDGTVPTDEVVVRRDDGAWRVDTREVADKTHRSSLVDDTGGDTDVGTGGDTDGGTAVRTVDRPGAAALSDERCLELAELGATIQNHFGRPMDVEWAMARGRLWIVQARPITALPEPIGDPPTDWSVPDRTGMYARASIVEQLPEPLTPLFGDMVEPAVTGSLTALFREGMGDLVHPGDLTFVRVNDYAYYHYSLGGLLRMSAGAVPMALTGKLRNPGGLWRETTHPAYAHVVSRWRERDPERLAATTLLDGAAELLYAGCEYYTSVQRVIPDAATSEILFTRAYAAVRRPGDPPATTFLLGGDSEPIRAEKSLFDLALWVSDRPQLCEVVGSADVDEVVGGPAPEDVDGAVWPQWQRRLREHLDRFGHAVYNLDFASPVAADTPAPVLTAMRHYLVAEPGSVDPRARQHRLLSEREAASAALLGRLDPVRRRVIEPLLRRAQDRVVLREDALADIGLAWPTIRRLLRELGSRLVEAGALPDRDDVFWLTIDEARCAARALDDDQPPEPDLADALESRRMTWRGQLSVTPPQLLPDNAMNRLTRRWMPQHAGDQSGNTLEGLAASGGRVTASACLVLTPADFAHLRPGMVLVSRITTPAYTPLFALASAVVTDVGGPLSHSSIVAREFGIPAVLGTASATQRIRDGQTITVDGGRGLVLLNGDADASLAAEGPETAGAAEHSPPARPDRARVAGSGALAAAVAAAGVLAGAGAVARRRARRCG